MQVYVQCQGSVSLQEVYYSGSLFKAGQLQDTLQYLGQEGFWRSLDVKSSQFYLYSSISQITNLSQGVLQSVQDMTPSLLYNTTLWLWMAAVLQIDVSVSAHC